jgi:peptidyl-prolyl cis-trans isomerase D
VFRVTDISVPPLDMASDDVKKMKDQLGRSLEDEGIAQYVTKLESNIGTTINEAAFAQVTGASNSNN